MKSSSGRILFVACLSVLLLGCSLFAGSGSAPTEVSQATIEVMATVEPTAAPTLPVIEPTLTTQPTQPESNPTPEKITLDNLEFLRPVTSPILNVGGNGLVIKGQVRKVAFSKDNALIGLCTTAGMGLYELASGNELWFLPNTPKECFGLSFSNSGEYLLVWENRGVFIRSVTDGTRVRSLDNPWNAFYSPDDEYILTVDSENIKAYAVLDTNLKPVFSLEAPIRVDRNIRGSFSVDGSMLASYSYGEIAFNQPPTIILWDWNTRTLKTTFPITSDIRDIQFAQDNQSIFVITNKGNLERWSMTGELLESFPNVAYNAVGDRRLSDYGTIFAGNFEGEQPNIFTVMDTTTRAVVYQKEGKLLNVTLSRDGRYLAYGDEGFEVVDLQSGQSVLKAGSYAPGGGWDGFVLSPDRSKIALFTLEGNARIDIIDLVDGKKIDQVQVDETTIGTVIQVFAFSPEGDALYFDILNKSRAEDGYILQKYDLTTRTISPVDGVPASQMWRSMTFDREGQLILLPNGIPGWAESMAPGNLQNEMILFQKWSDDFSRLAIVTGDLTLHIWDWKQKQAEKRISLANIMTGDVFDAYIPEEGPVLMLVETNTSSNGKSVAVLDTSREELTMLPTISFNYGKPKFLLDGELVAVPVCDHIMFFTHNGDSQQMLVTNLGCDFSSDLVLNGTALLAANADTVSLWSVDRR